MEGNILNSPVETQQFSDLYALAYDPIHQRMFFSVNEHNTSIFTFNLQNYSLTPIVPSKYWLKKKFSLGIFDYFKALVRLSEIE